MTEWVSGASERVSGASKWVYGHASGPVLTFGSWVNLAHSESGLFILTVSLLFLFSLSLSLLALLSSFSWPRFWSACYQKRVEWPTLHCHFFGDFFPPVSGKLDAILTKAYFIIPNCDDEVKFWIIWFAKILRKFKFASKTKNVLLGRNSIIVTILIINCHF